MNAMRNVLPYIFLYQIVNKVHFTYPWCYVVFMGVMFMLPCYRKSNI